MPLGPVPPEWPADLIEQEGVAHDVASAPDRSGRLPEAAYEQPSGASAMRAWPSSSF